MESSSKLDLGKSPQALEDTTSSNVRFINPSVVFSSCLISSKSWSCSRHRAASQERIAALQVSAVGGYPSGWKRQAEKFAYKETFLPACHCLDIAKSARTISKKLKKVNEP